MSFEDFAHFENGMTCSSYILTDTEIIAKILTGEEEYSDHEEEREGVDKIQIFILLFH